MRFCASAKEDTSMTQWVQPSAAILPKREYSSLTLGVVGVFSSCSTGNISMRTCVVPINPAFMPFSWSM